MGTWDNIQSLFANFINWFLPKFSWVGSIGNWFIEDFGTNNLLFLTKVLGTFAVFSLVYGVHIRIKGGSFINAGILCGKVLFAECFFIGLLSVGVIAIKEEAIIDLPFLVFCSGFILVGLFGILKGWSILTEHSHEWDDLNHRLKEQRK